MPHVLEARKKCIKALNLIKFLRGTWWGADPDTLLIMYKSYIIDYENFVYFSRKKIKL